MRQVRLTRAERAIEESLGEYVPVSKAEHQEIVAAIAARRKDAVLNIRVNRQDLTSIKQKAKRLGIKYQTFVSEVLHKVAQA
jgi:predicted DNA binding CopG/RHH family protein